MRSTPDGQKPRQTGGFSRAGITRVFPPPRPYPDYNRNRGGFPIYFWRQKSALISLFLF